jgi:hypothetical protein
MGVIERFDSGCDEQIMDRVDDTIKIVDYIRPTVFEQKYCKIYDNLTETIENLLKKNYGNAPKTYKIQFRRFSGQLHRLEVLPPKKLKSPGLPTKYYKKRGSVFLTSAIRRRLKYCALLRLIKKCKTPIHL